MSNPDDEVEQLLRRTRETRERCNNRMALIGETGHPIRSPLREKNVTPGRVSPRKPRSPIKTTYSPSKLTSTSQMLSPPSRSRSPIKTVTSTRSTTYHDDKEDGTKEQSQETYNREVTEKKTTIVDEPKVSGNKETFKKTTITEKEETIQKTEILKFTQIGCPSTEITDIDPLKLFEERRNQRRNERATGGTTSAFRSNQDASNNRTSVTKTVKFGDGGSQKNERF